MSIFISCDWGSSSLRLRLVESGMQNVLEEIKTKEGIGAIYKQWQQEKSGDRFEFYYAVLKKYTGNWENAPLLISGMASSSIGMVDLPYTLFPFHADGSDLSVKTFQHSIHIVSGACTSNDVMRGEETLLAGCDHSEDGIFIFPGTHSKHIRVENGMAKTFTTYMTGEFFELLSRHSVLAGSVQETGTDNPEFFARGILEGSKKQLLSSAFGVRVNQLFERASAAENYEYLSGLLIGAELQELAPGDHPLTIVAENQLLRKYLTGLTILHPRRTVSSLEAGKALLNGHFKIFSKLNHV